MRNRETTGERSTIRRKMVVGPADDRFEREADRVAKQVVTEISAGRGDRSDAAPVTRQSIEDEELSMKRTDRGEVVRRVAIGAEGGELDGSTSAEINAARSGGRPLDATLRRSVEGAFGADFSNVRMHTGARADRLNDTLGARAFTTGSDVFVRSSDYRPGSRAGQELIAHELTHVVQQGGAPELERG